MKKMLRLGAWGLAALLLVMVIRAVFTGSMQPAARFSGAAKENPEAVKRLSEIIRFRTVSYDDSSDGMIKIAALQNLYAWMRQSYPTVFRYVRTDSIHHSRLLTLQGKNPGLKPALFLAHLDVVPADGNATGQWQYPPFEGYYTADTIYGRGTLDDKSVATAMLEALEAKLQTGWRPERTLMLALGHDEETGGLKGAAEIAAFLKRRNITPEFICDEGFGVMEGLVPGTDAPVALIGTAEKGYMSVKIEADIPGGHSGTPKKENATSLLVRCLQKIEGHDFREEITEPQREFFRFIAPETGPLYRFLFSNLWITSPLVKSVLNGNEKSASTIHTSHSTTVIRAGDKDNVLPAHAEAIVNFRLLPGHSIAQVMHEVQTLLKGENVKISLHQDRNEASAVSPCEGPVWQMISESIAETFEGVVLAPALVVTGTDCKNYTGLTDKIYRFVPLRLNSVNLSGIHGVDEKIASRNYFEAIHYYGILFSKL